MWKAVDFEIQSKKFIKYRGIEINGNNTYDLIVIYYKINCLYFRIDVINICRLIGYGDCSFKVNKNDIDAAIRHFEQGHKWIVSNLSSLNLNFTKFTEAALTGNDSASGSWVPVIMTGKESEFLIIILALFDKDEQSIAWIPLALTNHDKFIAPTTQIEFSIFEPTNNIYCGLPHLKWSVSPIDIFEAEQILPNLYPFRIPTSLLKKGCTSEGSLTVRCKIKPEDKNLDGYSTLWEDPIVDIGCTFSNLKIDGNFIFVLWQTRRQS